MTIRGDVALPTLATALRERKAVKILTIGGSSRAGADPQNGGYNATIQRLLETSLKGVSISIVDQGISGELLRDASERIKAEVALNAPDLVIWQVGTSDAFSAIPVEEFEADLTETVRWLKQHNIDVVLIGLHFVRNLAADAHYQAIRHGVRRVAAAERVLQIRRYEVGEWREKSKTGNVPADEFATTEAGYSCMAEYVARAVSAAAFDKNWPGKPRN
ncbi:MAG: SGNH/GDSL hydrolase family protein [Hyphomicrobiaceae bacterium]